MQCVSNVQVQQQEKNENKKDKRWNRCENGNQVQEISFEKMYSIDNIKICIIQCVVGVVDVDVVFVVAHTYILL